jgi:hypothetical protein
VVNSGNLFINVVAWVLGSTVAAFVFFAFLERCCFGRPRITDKRYEGHHVVGDRNRVSFKKHRPPLLGQLIEMFTKAAF